MNEYANSIKKKLDTVLIEMYEYSWLFGNNQRKILLENENWILKKC